MNPDQSFQSQTPPQMQLPQVIFLRGDEDIAPSFTIDAQEAMELLGIKRSRLNQISGQELRVAKMRVDRYIKPFYRKEDIDAYRNWTRSTASHLSATKQLDSKGEEIIDKLDGFLDQRDDRIQDRLGDIEHQVNQKTLKTHHQLSLIERTLEANRLNNLRQVSDLKSHQSKITSEVKRGITSLNKSIQEHQSALNTQTYQVGLLPDTIKQSAAGLKKSLQDLASDVEALRARVDQVADFSETMESTMKARIQSIFEALASQPAWFEAAMEHLQSSLPPSAPPPKQRQRAFSTLMRRRMNRRFGC